MNTYTPGSTKIVHWTSVDMSGRDIVPRPVHLVQYDKRMPILAVKMYKDGQVYEIPDTATVNIRLGKKDRTFVYNPALGVDSSKTVVYFEITQQMVVLYGNVMPIVEIEIGNQVAGSGPIHIVVDPNPIQEDMIESTVEFLTAKEYALAAEASAIKAKTSETNAKASETNAKSSEIKAKTSETNAKSSETKAKTSEINAKSSETNARDSALRSKSFSDGNTGIREGENTDNSKYYSEKSKEYAESWKGSLLPKGTIAYSRLPVSGNIAGHMYNINEAFVTDSRFKDGTGYSYPAGTNVYWTTDGKWDCLSGILTKELTQAEYDSLTNVEKMNGTIYYIYDADNSVTDATGNTSGLLSPEDKRKLDGIASGATRVLVDTALSENSTNPLQNKVIKKALDSQKTYTDTKIADLINGAPSTLDTLGEIAEAMSDNQNVVKILEGAIGNKVDRVSGKGLSANDFTSAYKTKLDGIAAGAQVNSITGVKGSSESTYRQGNVNITASHIGLGNVENKSSATIRAELTAKNITDALGYTPGDSASIGSVTGIKGNAEPTYRTGMVNLTAEQIGAVPKYSQTIDLSEAIYDQSKWYPVTGTELPITKLSLIDVEVALNSDTKPSWSTHKEGFSCSLTVLAKGHGYGKTNGETIVLNHGCRWTDNVNPCGFSQLTYSSMPVLWMRGGGKYFVNTSYNCTWTPRTSTFNPNNYGQTVAPTTAFPGVAFPVKDTIYANLNGPASTAAKLSTARKIGNASFDGSKDISVIGMGASPLVSTYISPVSAGWYRFAKFQAGNAAGAQGAVDISCVINLKRTFANGSNETHKIQFLGIYQNAKFVPIGSRTNTHTITKIRYVTEGSIAYLDFYYARSVQNDIRISIEDPIASDGRIWSALPLTQVPETATGITVHASMDIPNTTYELNKTVPANAVLTDTRIKKNTFFSGTKTIAKGGTGYIQIGGSNSNTLVYYDITVLRTNLGTFMLYRDNIYDYIITGKYAAANSYITIGMFYVNYDGIDYNRLEFKDCNICMIESDGLITLKTQELVIYEITGYNFDSIATT